MAQDSRLGGGGVVVFVFLVFLACAPPELIMGDE